MEERESFAEDDDDNGDAVKIESVIFIDTFIPISRQAGRQAKGLRKKKQRDDFPDILIDFLLSSSPSKSKYLLVLQPGHFFRSVHRSFGNDKQQIKRSRRKISGRLISTLCPSDRLS